MGLLSSLKHRRSRSGRRRKDHVLTVKLDIVSDNICPYCYLLLLRLETAMKNFEPLAPPEGMPKHVYLEKKFKHQVAGLMKKKQEFFRSQGIESTFDGIIGNTFNSHRLVEFAQQQSQEKAYLTKLLVHRAYFKVQHQLECMYKDVIGVPHLSINDGLIRLGGAQDVDVLNRVFSELLSEHENAAAVQ